jgi:4-hydroxybenzoate polyprenyltransferase
MIPFEIRDKHKDMYNVKTIVHIYGIKNSKIIGYFILMTPLTLTVITYYLSGDTVLKNSTTLIILVTGVLIYLSSEKQNKYYSSFIVESVPMIWILIEFSLQVFF